MSALLHNRPQRIPDAVRAKIREHRAEYRAHPCALYADCGTGGELDRVLAEEGVERSAARIATPSMPADGFDALAEAEPGTFYLTDFLARQFDRW